MRGSAVESAAQTTLEEALRGTLLEGAVDGGAGHMDDDGLLEVVLLWALASARQTTSLRSSVIRPLGSDTSWIQKGAPK